MRRFPGMLGHLQLSPPAMPVTQEPLLSSSCLQQGYHNAPHGANRTCGFPSIRLSSNLLRDMVLHRFSILNSHMARFTDHERFPSSCRHDLHPERLFLPFTLRSLSAWMW